MVEPITPRDRTHFIGVAGQLAGVVAVLLPVIGAAVRVGIFTLEQRFPSPSRVGLAASLPVLTATGTYVVALAVVYAAPTLVLVWRGKRVGFVRDLIGIIGWIMIAVFVLVLMPFPSFTVLLAMGVGAGAFLLWLQRRGEPLSFGNGWPLILIFSIGAMTFGIFSGTTVGISLGDYRFDSDSHLDDGVYVELGRAEGSTFLHSCETGSVEVVRTDLIVGETMIDAERRATATLPDVIRGADVEVGIPVPCP